ncbi:hypothetical protein L1987_22110 [Smallanthus sonchifolius]|uniref:Uncharacterized protein n=1 Tax=Smallanthus sonchifolius TaxID=185202 RepID=A0ACB9ID88_9ASTR|nr:hypothetical protein L1987_22110 [Smallanthus sonchifolius]
MTTLQPKRSQQSDHFDEFLGNLSRTQKGESIKHNRSASPSGFDDLIPASSNRSSSEPTHKSTANTKATSISKDSTQKASLRYFASQSHVNDFQESHQIVYDIPEVSRNHHRSFDQSTSPPSYIETSSQMGQQADEIWLSVSEIPLFTQPTRAPPPARPPPPIPRRNSKPEKGPPCLNSRNIGNGISSLNSPKCSPGLFQPTEEMDSYLASAAMKEAMDRAEAKFRHAKEIRERENAKASRNKESMQPERDEQREKEEEEREQRRIEKERNREVERQKARQAVDRINREARERASVEARLKSERVAVQRAQAEACERAAVEAKERAEQAAMEAREKAEEDVRCRSEQAAVERVASETRKRAAAEARERAAGLRTNQQKDDNDLESFFSTGTRPNSAPRPRETSDSGSDPLSQNRQGPEGAHKTSSSGMSSTRKVSSTTNIVDDLSSVFGAGPTSKQFQEVVGESEERRRARLEREQHTMERVRIGGTLDAEIKRWAAGKEGNLRALLSTLQYVLWPECGWQPVSFTDLITGANVKKAYRKATLCIHPDKVQQKGANLQQKYVSEKVFDLLKLLLLEDGMYVLEYSSNIVGMSEAKLANPFAHIPGFFSMAAGEEDYKSSTRSSIKSHVSFNNYPRWKDKLRENCYNRVRADRSRLLWKMRLPDSRDHSPRHEELVKSTFQDIVSEELRKIKETPMKSCSETSDDMLWEYDGLHAAYQGECEEILLEMQKIFYEDLKSEQIGKEPDSFIKVWEEEEDEYLARAVFENMQLNDEKVGKEVWCPMCKQGVLQQNRHLIFCSLCELKLDRGDEVTLELLRDQLAEAHGQHFDRGCRLRPKFCIHSKFDITALYMECQDCNTFEIVI